jgi:hypothetical protein
MNSIPRIYDWQRQKKKNILVLEGLDCCKTSAVFFKAVKEHISIASSFLNKDEAIFMNWSKLYFIYFLNDLNENLFSWFKFIIKYSYASI